METTEKITKPRTWTLDKAHAKIGFAITHMLVSEIEGSFKSFDVTVNTSNDDFTGAEIEVKADVHSIDTANETRDNHLKQADFFHAEKNPALTFKSKSFVKIADKKYALNGDLTFNGVTKNIDLDVKGNVVKSPRNPDMTIAGFKVTGEVKRTDFNLGANFPTLALSNEVAITCNVELTTMD